MSTLTTITTSIKPMSTLTTITTSIKPISTSVSQLSSNNYLVIVTAQWDQGVSKIKFKLNLEQCCTLFTNRNLKTRGIHINAASDVVISQKGGSFMKLSMSESVAFEEAITTAFGICSYPIYALVAGVNKLKGSKRQIIKVENRLICLDYYIAQKVIYDYHVVLNGKYGYDNESSVICVGSSCPNDIAKEVYTAFNVPKFRYISPEEEAEYWNNESEEYD
jgi:hypothetical protein